MDHGRKTVGAAKGVAAKEAVKTAAEKAAHRKVDASAKPGNKPSSGTRFTIAAPLLEKLDVMGDPNEQRVIRLRTIVRYEAMALMVLALLLVAVVFTKEQASFYFAAKENAEAELLIPMPVPNYTDQAILSWVGSAASDILNFGFHNFNERMQESRRYFTADGWKSFEEALEKSQIGQKINEKQQVVTAAPIGAAVIVDIKEDEIRGTEWTVQIPFTVTVISGAATQAQRRILTVVIVRVAPKVNLTGLGIDNWVEIGG
jgi:intracellular multiplication protein IcmL